MTIRLAEITPANVRAACDIAAAGQGRGYGGPEGFYLRLGFRPTGEEMHGEVVGELIL